MDTVNVTAIAGANFIFTQPLGQWAELYPLNTASWRSQLRYDAEDATVLYEWSTANGNISFMPTPANGQITFTGNPSDGDTLIFGDTIIEFVSSSPGLDKVLIGPTVEDTLVELLAFLQSSVASQDASLSQCTYSSLVNVLNIVYKTNALSGNDFFIGASSGSSVYQFSGNTLTGAGGMIIYNSPPADFADFNGVFVYDLRAEWTDGTIAYLFGGTMTFQEGVTRH